MRIELVVAGPVRRDLMVFGAAPCSAGWSSSGTRCIWGCCRRGEAGPATWRRGVLTLRTGMWGGLGNRNPGSECLSGCASTGTGGKAPRKT